MDFCKFAICFADYLSRVQGLSNNVSNVKFENKGGRGSNWPPPPGPVPFNKTEIVGIVLKVRPFTGNWKLT